MADEIHSIVKSFGDGAYNAKRGGYDTVIVATGSTPKVFSLGDARTVSNIMYAIWDAFEVANHI